MLLTLIRTNLESLQKSSGLEYFLEFPQNSPGSGHGFEMLLVNVVDLSELISEVADMIAVSFGTDPEI